MPGTILFVVLILLIIGGLPNWGHTSGYWLSGTAGTLLIILLIILLLGYM